MRSAHRLGFHSYITGWLGQDALTGGDRRYVARTNPLNQLAKTESNSEDDASQNIIVVAFLKKLGGVRSPTWHRIAAEILKSLLLEGLSCA